MKDNLYISRPTKAIISKENFLHNFSVVKDLVGKRKIMVVLKANAYGHGLVESAKILKDTDYIGVAYIEEALILRKNGIKKPILVLGAVNSNQIKDFILNDIDITGSSLEKLIQISDTAKQLKRKARVHLKIDTGMGRIGVQYDRVERFFEEVFKLKNIEIVGIYTHFSSADTDKEYTLLQYSRFEEVLKKASEYVELKNLIIHIANSAFISNFSNLDLKDMVRVGLMLYGYCPNKRIQKRLKPVMKLETVVSYFKVLKKGSYIGYQKTFKTSKQERIITLPVGYADGYSIEFSNKGEVYLNGNIYPIVGTICMDQCMVNIDGGQAYVGDRVELFGEKISLWELCKNTNQSPYTVLTSISQRVPRIYSD